MTAVGNGEFSLRPQAEMGGALWLGCHPRCHFRRKVGTSVSGHEARTPPPRHHRAHPGGLGDVEAPMDCRDKPGNDGGGGWEFLPLLRETALGLVLVARTPRPPARGEERIGLSGLIAIRDLSPNEKQNLRFRLRGTNPSPRHHRARVPVVRAMPRRPSIAGTSPAMTAVGVGRFHFARKGRREIGLSGLVAIRDVIPTKSKNLRFRLRGTNPSPRHHRAPSRWSMGFEASHGLPGQARQ